MPEGPSIVILREAVSSFTGKIIKSVSGNTQVAKKILIRKKIVAFKSWGKHFLICTSTHFVRIHFMLFGSYRINESKENGKPRLSLVFSKGEINFYACSVKIEEGDVNDFYDWRTDVMSPEWSPAFALKQVKSQPERMICDVLMDQSIFTGVGNIIKNEVLFRIKIHPESTIGEVPLAKMKALVREASKYSFEFYEWKKLFVLKKHWKIYRSKLCPRCKIKPEIKSTGLGKRKSFICNNCQEL